VDGAVAPEILSASHPLLFTASHAALQSYLSKPDCFRLAVPLTDCDTLERDPEARVRGERILDSWKTLRRRLTSSSQLPLSSRAASWRPPA
jgi:hypothetical protein